MQVLKPSKENIKKAAKALQNGELVAFPTETVYGLGANALDSKAVMKIFKAKGRPADNPLIVHIASKKQLPQVVEEVPKKAIRLIKSFWPGPLTVVLKRCNSLAKEVSAGLSTIAVRMPSHPIAKALIKEAGLPIAAPSANKSGSPSPTRAEHVLKDFKESIVKYLIDGGSCRVGLESTVIDLTKEVPVLLRPGGITFEQLTKKFGKIVVSNISKRPASPGMKYRHYAPNSKLLLAERNEIPVILEACLKKGLKPALLCSSPTIKLCNGSAKLVFDLGRKEKEIARRLFAGLRELDSFSPDLIIAEKFNERGLLRAVMNRLKKAAN